MNKNTQRISTGCLHVWLLVVPIVLFTLTLWGVGFWAQPTTGDLTRISHYPDRFYGWNDTQEVLVEPRTRRVVSHFEESNNWPVNADILLFGDSFADPLPESLSWVDLIEQHTGLAVQVVKYQDFGQVLRYLHSDAFAANPPKLVILETVERYLRERALQAYDFPADCNNDKSVSRKIVVTDKTPAVLDSRWVNRREDYLSVSEFFERSVVYMRKLMKPKGSPVVKMDLTQNNLFSHLRSDQVLIYREDLSKHDFSGLSQQQIDEIRVQVTCGMNKMLGFSKSVPFGFVLVPDKLSVYAPWVKSVIPAKRLNLNELAGAVFGQYLIDLRPSLQLSIQQGVRDVYLPNDSHWGSAGQRVAAETVIQALTME